MCISAVVEVSMDDKKINNSNELEIDLNRLIRAVFAKSWQIGLVAVLCAVVTLLGTVFFVTPQYKSSAMFYVNNSAFSLGEASLSISSSDLSVSRGLVKSYIVILNSRQTLNDVVDYAGADRTYAEMKNMITAEAVDSTEIFRVTVTSPDPQEAERLANAVTYILPKRISSIIEGTSAKIVDSAVLPAKPSSPSYVKNTAIGFALGMLLMGAFVVIRELMDVTIRTQEDIADTCRYPILASVPDMLVQSKGGNYYGYGNTQAVEKGKRITTGQSELVGGSISFAAAEAYKLLRTKLQFSFADEEGCRVIGISSSLTGEGKSLSAANLAYSASQLGKRVLLIDCDMRRPTLQDKLPIRKSPGLSDFLTGQTLPDNLIQMCGIREDTCAFHAISSGHNPPNPMELLSSLRMERMINRLRKNYDYILLDLLPVGEVGDALAVSKLTDGILLVVRQNLCDRMALNSAIRQFEFVDAKILGVVLNCTTEDGSHYSKRYSKRYSKYGSGYIGNKTGGEKQKKAGKSGTFRKKS